MGFRSDSSISVLDDELFGSIQRTRKACVTARCVNVEDLSTVANMHALVVPARAKQVKLRDLWDASLKPVRRPGQRECCRSCRGHDEQKLIETEPPFLFICLRRRLHVGEPKRDAAVDFPRRIEWMRSGSYECVSAIHHVGFGTEDTGGHYTSTCKTSERAYHYFDDDERPLPVNWKHLENREQRKSVSALLYARVDLRAGARSTSVGALPFKIGQETQQLQSSLNVL